MRERAALVAALSALAVGLVASVEAAVPVIASSRASTSPLGEQTPGNRAKGVIASIPVSGAPLAVAFGFGSVWVTSHRNTLLYRIDPKRNRIEARIDIGQESCLDLEIGARALWVTSCGYSPIAFRIDPRTNKVVGTRRGSTPVLGAGSVWVVVDIGSPGAVIRFDEKTGRRIARIPVGAEPLDLLFALGSLWVYNADATVSRIDPATNEVVATVAVGAKRALGYLAAGGDAIWFPNDHDGRLYRIDAKTNRARGFPIGATRLSEFSETFVSFARASVWVRTRDRVIAQIDPHTGMVERTFPAGSGGGHFGIGFGSLWVANFGDDTVWRLRLAR